MGFFDTLFQNMKPKAGVTPTPAPSPFQNPVIKKPTTGLPQIQPTPFMDSLTKSLQNPQKSPFLESISKVPVNNIDTIIKPIPKDPNYRPQTWNDVAEFVRFIPRAVAKIGISAGNIVNTAKQGEAPKTNTLGDSLETTGNPVTQFIFGKEPITSLQSDTKKLSPQISTYLNEKGLSKESSHAIGSVGAPIIAVGGSILDLSGFGPEEGVMKKIFGAKAAQLVKEGTVIKGEVQATQFLKSNGFSDELVQKTAPLLAATTSEKETKNVLQNAAAEHIQYVEHTAQNRLQQLEEKAKGKEVVDPMTKEKTQIPGEILSHDDMAEINFLKKNANNPVALLSTYSEVKPEISTLKPITDTVTGNTNIERKYITSAKASDKVANEIKSELAGVYDAKSNQELVARANERVASNIDDAVKLATSESTDEAIATGVSLAEHYSNEITKAATKEEKVILGQKAADILNKQAEVLTEAGRTVQAAYLMGKQTPEGMIRTTARKIKEYNKTAKVKVPELNGEDVIDILEQGKKIESMDPGLAKDVATKKLSDTLESKIPTPMWKKIITVWKAGLLTGIKTTGVNLQSNFWNGVGEKVKDIPATGIDMATSLITKNRTKSFTLKGELGGNKEGIKKGWDYLKTGVSPDAGESALEFSKIHFDSKPGKVMGAYTDAVYRVLGAEDMPFFYGSLKRSLAEQAIVTIKNEKKVFSNSLERNKFIQDFIDNPPEKALELADLDAKIATFRNDTALGKVASSIQNSHPAVQVILPFAKTPSAVATQMFNYTPAGPIIDIAKMITKGEFNQKQFAESLGRGITGTGALWLGSELYKKGKISLEYPTDEKERAQWEATGKTPNSVLIGNKWLPLVEFGPQGSAMGIGGYFEKGRQETGSTAGGAVSGLFGGMKGLTEQTFLTGVKNLTDALNEPNKKGVSAVAGIAASVVPTIISDFTQAFDDYQRKASGSFLGPLKARTPGLRQTLPKKLDVWGQPLERNRTEAGTAISPVRLSNSIQGTLNTEVERLGQLGEDIRPTKVDSQINNIKLDNEEYYMYQRLYGNIVTKGLNALIENSDYQSKDPEDQAKLWKDAMADIRKATADALLPEILRKRYDFPEDQDMTQVTNLVKELNKKSPDFAKASPEKQKKVIENFLNKTK